MSVTTDDRDAVMTENLTAIRADLPADFARADRRRWRRRIVAIALGILLVLGGATTAVGAISAAGKVNAVRQVTCYEKAKLTSRSVGVAQGERTRGPNRDRPLRPADPIEECQALWQAGLFGGTSRSGTSAVPPMAVCVTESGIAAVLPKRDDSEDSAALCNRLGVVPWPGS